MKFESRLVRELHSEIVTGCCWMSSGEEFVSCADDQTMKRIDAESFTSEVVVPDTGCFVTKLSLCPSLNEKQTSDVIAAACSDGSLRLINTRSGREEKKVDAYKSGAAIAVAWNSDGSAIATGGEDGCVKIWSRVGMLRNTVATCAHPIYCVGWGRQDEILYSSHGVLTIEHKERKKLQWKAHDAVILSVDWNMVSNQIVSGGEDCKYKVWDSLGRILFHSAPLANVVTSVSWSPNASCFAVGSFNTLRLCDPTGWTHHREDFEETGSLMSINWNSDGSMLCAASSSGALIVSQLVGRVIEYKHFQATLKDVRTIEVVNSLNDSAEIMAFRDRIQDFSLEYDHLVVHCTTPQIHVYSLSNLSTPKVIDTTPTRYSFILQSSKVFLAAWNVYSYDGRRICSSSCLNGINLGLLDRDTIALNDTYLAVLENSRDAIRLIDLVKQQPIGVIKHTTEISQLAICKLQTDMLIFTDRNGDLYLQSSGKKTFKLPVTMVESIKIHDDSDALVACVDGGNRLMTWYYPQVVWLDQGLLPTTCEESDMPQLIAQNPKIVSFHDSLVTVQRKDGALVTHSVSRYPTMLYQLVLEQRKWEDGIRLCRFINKPYMWAILAAMALKHTHLDTSEIALAAIENVDKLHFVLHIKDLQSETAKMAELALYKRDIKGAEQILLQANPPLLYRAIKMNLRLFRWDRARQIAKSNKELLQLIDLYQKQWESRELLPDAELNTIKQIKLKYSEKSYDDEEEDGDGAESKTHESKNDYND